MVGVHIALLRLFDTSDLAKFQLNQNNVCAIFWSKPAKFKRKCTFVGMLCSPRAVCIISQTNRLSKSKKATSFGHLDGNCFVENWAKLTRAQALSPTEWIESHRWPSKFYPGMFHCSHWAKSVKPRRSPQQVDRVAHMIWQILPCSIVRVQQNSPEPRRRLKQIGYQNRRRQHFLVIWMAIVS